MRLLKVIFSLLVITITLPGVSQKVYLGIYGGPRWTFQSMDNGVDNLKPKTELSVLAGLVGGIKLNDKHILETGAVYNKYSLGFTFKKPFARFKVQVSNSFQIPIRYTHKIYSYEGFDISIGGGIIGNFGLGGINELPWDSAIVADGLSDTIVITQAEIIHDKKFSVVGEIQGVVSYSLSNQIEFALNIGLQTSFDQKYKAAISHSNNGIPQQTTTFSSNGTGPFATITLRYYLTE